MNSPYGLYEYGCTLPVIQQDRVVLDPDIELPFYSYQFLPSHEKPFFSEEEEEEKRQEQIERRESQRRESESERNDDLLLIEVSDSQATSTPNNPKAINSNKRTKR